MSILPDIHPELQWKPVVGYEEYYAVSECGHVVTLKSRRSVPAGKMLSPGVDKYGYCRYQLSANGVTKGFPASHLVFRAFVGEIPAGHEIDHIDNKRANNHYTNLQPLTHVKNIEKAWKDNRKNPVFGEASKLAKLDDQKVIEARRNYAGCLESTSSMARRWGVSKPALTAAIHGVTWQHIPLEPAMIFIEQIRRGEIPEMDEETLIAMLESGVSERLLFNWYWISKETMAAAREQVALLREIERED